MHSSPYKILLAAPSFIAQKSNIENLQFKLKELEQNYSNNAWSKFEILPNDKTLNERETLERQLKRKPILKEIEILVVARMVIDIPLLNLFPKLKAIVKFGVGLDNIFLHNSSKEFEKREIQILHKPGQNADSVAQLTVGLILGLIQNIFHSGYILEKNLVWQRPIGNSLIGKKIGIIGCGHIGKKVVELLQPFAADFFLNDVISLQKWRNSFLEKNTNFRGKLRIVSKNEIYRKCDCISLHTSLNSASHSLINKKTLSLMQNHTLLINTSRGEVVQNDALYDALVNDQIRAAAIDVFTEEPFGRDSFQRKLLRLPNFFATPHLGSRTIEAQNDMAKAVIEKIVEYITSIKNKEIREIPKRENFPNQ